MLKEQDIQSIINMCKLVHSETDFRRIPMEVEQTLMDQIRLGKFEEIHTIKFDKINTNLGYMAVNPLLQCSFVVVSSIALFSRAAIEGGAVPDDAFDLSDALILSISYCKTVDETFEIYHLGAVMFAKLVHKHLKTKHSSQVERIMNYISRNIYKKITLNDLSDYVQLSPNYMCILFSNQVGLSIHNYIQREKMNLACNLLRFSDRSISDISSYMGFQTQSNFSSVFKKWIKMSPSEYRERNYKEVF